MLAKSFLNLGNRANFVVSDYAKRQQKRSKYGKTQAKRII